MKPSDPKSFRDETAGKQKSLFAEFWLFVFQNKKWWLAPIIVLLVMMGVVYFASRNIRIVIGTAISMIRSNGRRAALLQSSRASAPAEKSTSMAIASRT